MKPADLEKLVKARRDPKAWAHIKDSPVLKNTDVVTANEFVCAVAKGMGFHKPPPPWFRCWALGISYSAPF